MAKNSFIENVNVLADSLNEVSACSRVFDSLGGKAEVFHKIYENMENIRHIRDYSVSIEQANRDIEDAKKSAQESQKSAKDSKINASFAQQSAKEAQQSAKEAKTDMHILKAFRALGVGRWYIKDGALHIKPFEDMGMAPALKDGALILKIS